MTASATGSNGGTTGVEAIITALAIPTSARVDQRIPKKLLLEQAAPLTAADRRQLQDSVEELFWVAALKPGTVGIPAYRDEVRDYAEIAVLTVTLRPEARAARIGQLIHRAIPYPVVLVTSDAAGATLSLAHKRLSQAAAEQRVLEEVETTPLIGAVDTHAAAASFLADLALGALPARDLYAAYQSWTDRITALASARITGHYRSPNGSGATTGRAALDEHARLGREIAALRKQAMKETQLARRVDLNLAIRRLSEQLAALTATL